MIPPFTTAHRRCGGRGGLLCLSVLLLGVLAAGCDKAALVAPGSSTITISVSSDTVALGGTTTITAMVVESSGTPVQNGTLVTFTTNLGTLNPPDNTTVNGKATTTLVAGTLSGTASVGASSGSAVAEKVEVVIGGAAAATVTVGVSPSTVPASGGVVTVTASVADAVGNPVVGIPVHFRSDNGTFDAATETTNGSGQARVQLTTNRDTTVTVNAGGKEGTAKVTVTPAPVIAITASAGTGTSTLFTGQVVSFTVTPSTSANAAPIQNVTVSFGDGTSTSLGAIGAATTISHIYSSPGNYTVAATARDTFGQQSTALVNIYVQARPPLTFSLTASPTSPKVDAVVTFTISSLPSAWTLESVFWEFGDGGTTLTTSLSTTHVYTSTGRKVVKATVHTVEGGTGVAQTEVVVQPPS